MQFGKTIDEDDRITATRQRAGLSGVKKSPAVFAAWLIFMGMPACARATQTHGEPEGLFVHQMAHLFFMFSMGLLIFWLRKRRLTTRKGWRSIQYGAFFFILWNINTLLSHWLEEQSALIRISTVGISRLVLETDPSMTWLCVLYYVTKLDHLLCVPALFLLFLGLRRLSASPSTEMEPGGPMS